MFAITNPLRNKYFLFVAYRRFGQIIVMCITDKTGDDDTENVELMGQLK